MIPFLQTVTEFTIEPITAQDRSMANLFSHGKILPAQVPGCVLEAQFRYGAQSLLFLTHDTPYEERLDIVLLNQQGQIQDRAAIQWPYAAAGFANGQILHADSLRFEFLSKTPWILRILEKPTFYLPLLSEPRAVWRPFGFRRSFLLQSFPPPPFDRSVS